MQPRLTRSRTDRIIGGVCGGLGYYFGIDPVIVRLIFVVVTVTAYFPLFIYPILWLIMPEAGSSSSALPPDAHFDPMTGQPLPPRQSWSQASREQSGASAPYSPPNSPPPAKGGRRTLGLLLLGVGGIALLNMVGDVFGRMFGISLNGLIMPILLVGLGLYLLRRKTV